MLQKSFRAVENSFIRHRRCDVLIRAVKPKVDPQCTLLFQLDCQQRMRVAFASFLRPFYAAFPNLSTEISII
jgi:hypothetical protein